MQMYKYDPTTLQLVPTKNKPNLKLLAFIVTICISLGFTSAVRVNTIFERIPVVLVSHEDVCDSTNVKTYIQKLHIRFPDVVYRQVLIESGHFSSPIFRGQHNLLGMQVSDGRPTTGKNVGQRFASYDNWKESLVDYALWQAAYASEIQTEGQYYDFLDRIYCEPSAGPKYSIRLKQVY